MPPVKSGGVFPGTAVAVPTKAQPIAAAASARRRSKKQPTEERRHTPHVHPLVAVEGTMANNPRQAERETTEMGQASTRRAAEQTAQTARTMSEATERTARAGAEAVRRNTENLNESWRSGTDAASRMAERSIDQFSKMFGLSSDTARQTLQRSSGNLRAVIESTTIIIAGGLQNVSGQWMRFAQSRFEDDLDRFDELMDCRTVPDCSRATDRNRPRSFRGAAAEHAAGVRTIDQGCRRRDAKDWRDDAGASLAGVPACRVRAG